MGIPLSHPEALDASLRERVDRAVEAAAARGVWRDGPEVEAFERELAAWLGAKRAVGLSSGTDALLVALMALGVGPGDQVVTSPFASLRVATTIVRCGARPVFADIDPESFALDPAKAEAAIRPETRALLVPHLFGRTADLGALAALAARRGIPLLEDASHALGAEDAGRRAGSVGRAGCMSLSPGASVLSAWGEAGALVTSDDALAERVKTLRQHGFSRKYVATHVGGNFRQDEIQAAVLRVKLPEAERWAAARQDLAWRYQDLFGRQDLSETLSLPQSGPGRHVWSRYVVRIRGRRRTDVFEALGKADIGREVYYPLALHQQPCFERLGHAAGAFPHAERAASEVLAIPLWPGLTEAQQTAVVLAIARALAP